MSRMITSCSERVRSVLVGLLMVEPGGADQVQCLSFTGAREIYVWGEIVQNVQECEQVNTPTQDTAYRILHTEPTILLHQNAHILRSIWSLSQAPGMWATQPRSPQSQLINLSGKSAGIVISTRCLE